VQTIQDYRSQAKSLPRILLVVDEYQKLFDDERLPPRSIWP